MGLETIDPIVQVPGSEWSLVVVIVATVHVFTFLAASVSALKSERLAPGGRLLWIAVFLLVPIVGPIAWFLWGRQARLDREVG